MYELAYFNKYFIKYRYHFLLALFFIIGSHVFSIIPARLVKLTFDFIKVHLDTYDLKLTDLFGSAGGEKAFFDKIAWFIGLILLMSVLKFICAFWMRRIIISVAGKVEQELKNNMYQHYQSLPLEFYRTTGTGNLLTLITDDVARVKLFLGPAILFASSAVVLFIILIPHIFLINARLAFYSMLPVVLLLIVIYAIKDFVYQGAENMQAQLGLLTTQAQETFSGIRILQAFVREKKFIERFKEKSEKYRQIAIRLTAAQALSMPLAIGMNSLGIILVVWIGGQEVAKGKLTIGDIAEFVMYMHLINWPVVTISLVANYVQKASASQKRINQLFAKRPTITSQVNLLKPIKGDICFESVVFKYADTGVTALKNVSFQVAAGTSVLILGMTGSGKSTLANLLVRFYDPLSGRITVDGISIKDYQIGGLRDQVGYVSQEVFCFPGTIKSNILFGKSDASEASFYQAIKWAGLEEMLAKLPQGFDTMVGERGVTLSGGQKQRIALARAFIRNPRILILDDAFSALDAQTEQEALVSLKEILVGRTAIIIGNRLSLAQQVDEVIFLEKGLIVEKGTHADLWAKRGAYYRYAQKNQEDLKL